MAAAASSSGAKAGPEELVGIGELLKRTGGKITDVWNTSVHQITIGGVTVTVTGALYVIISYIYSFLTTANITFILEGLAPLFTTTVTALRAWLTPEIIVLLLLASVLGATIEPITVAIAISSTSDAKTREIRVEQVKKATELMKTPGNVAYELVGTLFGKVSAAATTEGLKDKAITAMASAGSAMASGAAAMASGAAAAGVYAQEFIVGPPALVKRREDILRLRRAIYIYYEAIAVATKQDEQLRDNANYLMGQIVTELGKLNAAGITDGQIESYIGKGLPGITGKMIEVGVSASKLSEQLYTYAKTIGVSMSAPMSTLKYVFHGDLANTRKDTASSPLTEATLEVDSMIRTFKELDINPPKRKILIRKKPEEVLSVYPPSSTSERALKRDRASSTSERSSQRTKMTAEPSDGRRTRRKHKPRHTKSHKKSRRHRRTVSNRRGKRTHDRRRTNRRTTKRSKK